MSFKVPEQFRYTNSRSSFKTTKDDGNNGVFYIPHQKIRDYVYQCIVSDGDAGDGKAWEHVSVCLMNKSKNKYVKRCPTWEDMCHIKSMFWGDEDRVVQYHPPKSEYVNNVDWVLHLWRPVGSEIISPPSIMVGIKNK